MILNRITIILLFLTAALAPIVHEKFCSHFLKNKIISKNIKVAVVNSDKIKTKSLPFVRIRELLENEHARIHQEILEQEQKLRNEHEKLKKNGVIPEEKMEFDKKVSVLEQNVQQAREKLSKQFNFLTEFIESKLNEIIEEIVKEYGFNLVLNTAIQETRAILYNDAALNITHEVIKRLDKRLPDLKLPNGADYSRK